MTPNLHIETDFQMLHKNESRIVFDEPDTQQILSMGPTNISLRTLTISCDYLRDHVVAIRLYGINSDIIQSYPHRYVSIG